MPLRSAGTLPQLIVYPHDGPIARSAIGFDPYVQFFASRGFAVLQINHRGSHGFNFDFLKAGYREWGGKMQQDVYDGIEWLAAQKLVDPDRTCFVGHGYGGFVALTAARERPKQFDCFVSIGGISDIVDHVQSIQKSGVVREQFEVRVGNIDDREQRKQLRAASPIEHAARIVDPVLLIHGENDATVPHQQSQLMFSRIKYNNRNNRFVSLKYGTHALDDNAHRLEVFRALDEFLSRHLR
jgi:dipeptidyl aminopeptidase/acylaminoacyl peptidase